MDKVIRLHGSAHDQTQRLLPWYNNGTLDADENALVSEHLAECAECREDLAADQLLSKKVSALPMDVEHGWATVGRPAESDIVDEPRVAGTGRVISVPFWRRPVPVAWMLTGQAAAVALVFAAFTIQPHAREAGPYHVLGAAPVTAPGNVVVVFEPKANESEMRETLRSVGAHVVDGPNVSGAYVLRVADDHRDQALAQLRAARAVVLAEPIGDGSNS